MERLQQLLKNIFQYSLEVDPPISNIQLDSRLVKTGDLFIACVGDQYDGRKFIHEAIEKNAAAILCELGDRYDTVSLHENGTSPIPIIPIPDLRKKVGAIAANFYEDPSQQMDVVGFTGTNGKTSSSQFLAQALSKANIACGIIGTLGIGFPEHLNPINLTTPDAVTLQKALSELKKAGAKAVAMEVSSHSLAQYRVDGVHFKIAVFTNLTRDHLDYHGNMLNYATAKRRLFEQPGLEYAVINLDDEYGRQFAEEISSQVQVYGYSLQECDFKFPTTYAKNIKLTAQGLTAHIASPFGEGELKSHLLGRFNISNLLSVLITLNLLKIPFEQTLQFLSDLKTVPGRLQMLGGDPLPTVVVDYAHTPDALEKVLKALREHCANRLICVFGCGGERDRGKRPLMAEVAERCSDKVFVTDDNPRREYSQKIIEDIMAGFLYPHRVTTIPDRKQAISEAIQFATKGDVVLIAGKGHETYQIIGTEKFPFSDVEEANKHLK